MADVVVNLTIMMQTALSVGAGGSSGTIADKSILRDGWNRPIIPGSQVKGKVRHAAEAMACSMGLPVAGPMDDPSEQCVVQPIFGAKGTKRARVFFNDLTLAEPNIDSGIAATEDISGLRAGRIRPSVSINRRRGVAEDQRLLFQETTPEHVVFCNARAIVGNLDSKELALLLAALHLTTRWGGAKSRGLGWATIDVQAFFDGQLFTKDQLKKGLHEWEGQL